VTLSRKLDIGSINEDLVISNVCVQQVNCESVAGDALSRISSACWQLRTPYISVFMILSGPVPFMPWDLEAMDEGFAQMNK
jgi:hypothetical protein